MVAMRNDAWGKSLAGKTVDKFTLVCLRQLLFPVNDNHNSR